MNLCGACDFDFGSVRAFDRHRVGVHEYSYSEGVAMEPLREDGRRCLRRDEFAAKGLVLDARGRWVIPVSESAQEWFQSIHASRVVSPA